MKKTLLAICVSMLAPLASGADFLIAAQDGSGTRLLSRPSGSVLEEIPARTGTSLRILARVSQSRDGWFYGSYKGTGGWIEGSALRACTRVETSLVAEPDPAARVVAELGLNAPLRPLNKRNGWFLVSSGNATGWVQGSVISVGARCLERVLSENAALGSGVTPPKASEAQ